MSMLSAQCDELRAMAESVGLAMPQAATLMMEAADTIWELRCRLVDAEDRIRKAGELCKLCEREHENVKLREQLAKARDPQRIGGTADPESFVYAIEQLREFRWQHATNDEEAIPYINNVADAHEREIAELWELVESRKWIARMLGEQTARVVNLQELLRDMFRDFANADYELNRNHGKTFMVVTRYEPRLQELGVEL